MLVANLTSDTNVNVGVMLGNGDGSFQSVVLYGSGSNYAVSVEVADVNGDGKPDLVVANQCADNQCANGAVGVLTGNGDGTFQTAVTFNSGGISPSSAVVADVNRDGKPDLLAINNCASVPCNGSPGSVGVLLNKIISVKTTTKLISSLNPSLVNQSVTLSATITASALIPNGSVITFYNGLTQIGTGATTDGTATLTSSFPKPKTYRLLAKYPGDPFHKGSSGVRSQIVALYPSTTISTSSPNPSIYGQTIMLSATVSSDTPGGPTGKVTFKNGITTLGMATLSAGTATLVTKKLPIGMEIITARYGGDPQTAKSSGTVTQVVNP